MSLQDYMHLLSEMKIVVFNHKSQQAMGNISASLGLNCKVYIRSDSPMWKYYKKELGYIINDALSISNITFDEFNRIDSNQEGNIQIYLNVSSNEHHIKQWKYLFRNIESVNDEE